MAFAHGSAGAPRERGFTDLIALAERRLADAFGGRIARLYGWGIAGSYSLALVLMSSRTEAILSQALVALAWIPAGLVALGAARDQARLDEENGIAALVRQRGFEARDLELARFFGAARRIAKTTGWPALALVLVSLARARGMDALLLSGTFAVGALVFVLCLSLLLAALARASAVVSGGRGRLVFAAFVFVPHLAHSLFPWLPSVPRMLGDLLDVFFARGGG